ncbi:MAG: MFS transporter, partial [Pseudomonadota bacterium]
VDAVGWRMVFAVLAAITFAVAIWIWFGVPSRPSAAPAPPPLATQISQLGTLMRDPIFLAVAPMLALTAGTQIAVQTLWAGPWLRDVAGLDEQGVADLLAFAAVAFLVGVLVSGTIADRLQARGVSLLTTMMGFLVLFIAAQAALIAELLSYNALIWFIYGMSGQVAVLAYPWLAQYFGAERAGRSNAAINLSLFATAFALQYAIGLVIDLYPKIGDGYPPEAYRTAFAIALAMQLAAVLWFLRHRAEIRKIDLAFRSGAHVSSSRRG